MFIRYIWYNKQHLSKLFGIWIFWYNFLDFKIEKKRYLRNQSLEKWLLSQFDAVIVVDYSCETGFFLVFFSWRISVQDLNFGWFLFEHRLLFWPLRIKIQSSQFVSNGQYLMGSGNNQGEKVLEKFWSQSIPPPWAEYIYPPPYLKMSAFLNVTDYRRKNCSRTTSGSFNLFAPALVGGGGHYMH